MAADLVVVRRDVELPASLWLRSGRPFQGTALRVGVSFACILFATFFPYTTPIFWVALGVGVIFFFTLPLLVQAQLRPLENRVEKVREVAEAETLLRELRAKRIVNQFAPYGWLALQEAKLHMRRGDGRAAAKAFSEVGRLSRLNNPGPEVLSAQADAHILAGDRNAARAILQELEQQRQLSDWAKLNVGMLALHDGDVDPQFKDALEGAGGYAVHPRSVAARALLAAKLKAFDEARGLIGALEGLDAREREQDFLLRDFLKRAKKTLRANEVRKPKAGKAAASKTDAAPAEILPTQAGRESSETKPAPQEKKKKSGKGKKARKRDRRQARREQKAQARAAKQAEREAQQRAAQAEQQARLEAGLSAVKEQAPVGSEPAGQSEPKLDVPATDTVASSSKAEAPAAKMEAPAAKTEAPAAKVEAPAAKMGAPAAKTEAPAAKVEAPAAKVEAPAAKTEAPAAKAEAPAVKKRAPRKRNAAAAPVVAPEPSASASFPSLGADEGWADALGDLDDAEPAPAPSSPAKNDAGE